MWGDGDEVDLGHGGDFGEFFDASDVGDVGVDDVGGSLLEGLSEFELGVELFAGDCGDVDLGGGGGEGGHVLGPDGFFEPEGFVFLDHLGESDGVGWAESAVDFEEDVDVGSDGFSDGADAVGGEAEFFHADVAAPASGDGVELEGVEASVDHGSGSGLEFFDVVHLGPAVGVDAEAIADGAAEELVDGHAGSLAGEVPHGLFDAGNG